MRIYTAQIQEVVNRNTFSVVIATKEREKSTHYAIAEPRGRTGRGGDLLLILIRFRSDALHRGFMARETDVASDSCVITQAFTRDVPNRASECAFGASGI